MTNDETRELVKSVARKRLSSYSKFDRYMRACEERIPGENCEERAKRLADMHWELFDEPPPENPKAERPGTQPVLPLDDGGEH